MSRSKVVSDDTLLVSRSALTLRCRCRGRAARAGGLPRRSGASARPRSPFADRRCGESRRAAAARRSTLPTPKMKPTGFGARNAGASPAPSTAKPRGLSRSEAILARNLLQDSPIETVMRELLLDLGGKARQHLGRRHAVQALGAGEIEKRLVDRQRLDQRRQRQHHLAHLAADARIFLHVRPHDAGVRTQPQRLEHRHRRAHAVGAGDVAGGGDDAAPAAADDHRLGGERRIVALFDRGVERVAIDMGDGESVAARRGAASRGEPQAAQRALAAAASARQSRQKPRSRHVAFPGLAAERAAGASRSRPGRCRRCRQTRSGDSRRRAYGRARRRESRARARRRGFRRGRCPVMPRKAAEPFRLLGDEPKRLNCQHFRRFPACRQTRFSCGSICLSVIYRD